MGRLFQKETFLGRGGGRAPALLDIAITLLVVFAFVFVQWGTGVPDPDSYYHMRAAMMMKDLGGPLRAFPYFTETVWARQFVDAHFLYHAYLIPFLPLGPLLGLKVATGVAVGAGTLLMLRILRVFGSSWGPLVVPAFLFSRGMLFRMNLQKAPPVSVVFFVLGVWALMLKKKRPLAVFALAILYVLLYNGWLVFVLAAFAILTGEVLAAHLQGEKVGSAERSALKTGLALVAGIGVGLLVHPNFPHNLWFSWFHIFQIGVLNAKNLFGMGAEWYPYPFHEIARDGALGLIAVATLLVVFADYVRRHKRFDMDRIELARALGLTILVLIFFPLAIRSRRHIEYAIPSLVLWSGYLLMVLRPWAPGALFARMADRLRRDRVGPKIAAGTLAAFALLVIPLTYLLIVRAEFARSPRGDRYHGAAAWLAANTQKDSIIFHSDWSEPPFLLFHSLHNRYLVALDPTFFYQASPERFLLWQDITRGSFAGDLSAAIRSFGAEVVFISKGHDAMERLIQSSSAFQELFRDDEAVIFGVRSL